MNGKNRELYGCLTTWEREDGYALTIHRTGPLKAALRTAAAIALGEDESYRLVAYSTPATIYSDLTGARADALQPPRGFKATYSKPMPKQLPEVNALARAGLPRALLHPRLERQTAHPR